MDQIACGYLNPFAGKGVDGKLRIIELAGTTALTICINRDGNWMDRALQQLHGNMVILYGTIQIVSVMEL
jgi:hypothetical protein